MQELEKILEEIELEKKRTSLSPDCSNEHAVTEIILLEKIEKIIRKHMNDGWIPVEKALPEGETRVLCQFDNGDIELLWQNWESDRETLAYWTDFDFMADKKVIAWRPLPDPYRPERREG